MSAQRIYETDSVDIGSFLILNEIPYLGCRVVFDPKSSKSKAVMKFLDEKQNARDLERLFLTSPCKRFREANKYLLKEVHKACDEHIKEIKEGNANE